jgi:hypothetical protein
MNKKILLIVLMMTLSSSLFSNNTSKSSNTLLKYSFIERGETYTIYKVSNGVLTWYETVASIATFVLPETVYGICLLTLKKPSICAAVYAVTQRLVTNNYNRVEKGMTKGINWVANKGRTRRSTSTATIKTSSKQTARDAGIVFNEYKKLSNIKWNSIKNDCGCGGVFNSKYIALYNANGRNGSAKRTQHFLNTRKQFKKHNFVVFQKWQGEQHDYRNTKIIYRKGYKEIAKSIARSMPGAQYIHSYEKVRNKYALRIPIKIAIFVGKENRL